MFPTTSQLQALISLRSRYVLSILIEAKDSFEMWKISLPEGLIQLLSSLAPVMKLFPSGAGSSSGSTSNMEETASKQAGALVSLITAYDNLQPPSTWVEAWVSLLAAGKDFKELGPFLEKNTGISQSTIAASVKQQRVQTETPAPADDDQAGRVETSSTGKVDGNDEEMTPKLKMEVAAKAEDVSAEPSASTIQHMLCLNAVNTFIDMSHEGSEYLHHSEHAKTLGLHAADMFSAQGLKVLEHKLTCVVWKSFDAFSTGKDSVFLNLQSQDSKSRVQIKRPVSKDLCLPFAGPVTQNPQVVKDGKGFHVTTLFGLPFYISALSGDVLSQDVLVPAWTVRSVTKADAAYFLPGSTKAQVLLQVPDHVEKPTLLDVELMFVHPSQMEEAKQTAKEYCYKFGRYCYLICPTCFGQVLNLSTKVFKECV